MSPKTLSILNARENNLRNVSLEIPHDTFTVLTGLSGSGKSSLAFDTVYAEGQRRYIETFSPYTRQFFDKVKKPDVDHIDNVRPAIAIQQRTRITNSRSTVGSMTSVNDYLKILWSALALPYCPTCKMPMRKWDAAPLTDHLITLHRIKNFPQFLICAPLPLGERGPKQFRVEIERLSTLGYSRSFNPLTQEVESWEEGVAPKTTSEGVLLLILDRLKGSAINKKRLKESIDQAFLLTRSTQSGSVCWVLETDAEKVRPYRRIINTPSQENEKGRSFQILEFRNTLSCPYSQSKIEPPKPSLFSFNTPIGACPTCTGFGKILKVAEELCVPNPMLSIEEKALQCWAGEGATAEFRKLRNFCKEHKISTTTPWINLSEADKDLIFNNKTREYRGVNVWFKMLERKSYKMHVRVFLSKYRTQVNCPECKGTRLKQSALAYRVGEKTLPDLWNMPIGRLLAWLQEQEDDVKAHGKLHRELAELFHKVYARLQFLLDLGLSYLTLERQARTLSGGETQRVNLAAALGSDLISTHFVLDEPSIGLHARDTTRLISAMRGLQKKGNSLLVVEHDLDCITEADHIIELGPEAGTEGGEVIYSGDAGAWAGIEVHPRLTSFTGEAPHSLQIKNACVRNLKGISFDIPLGKFVALTGVSGSGKSTLVQEVIEKRYDEYSKGMPIEGAKNIVTGFNYLEQLLVIDQSPLARSPRGNIGTYSGIWDTIREMLAESDDAIAKALSKSAFSFNVDGGRCPECKGAGFIREDMQFLSDVYIPCEVCLGKRFQESVLSVEIKGKNAHDFLKMSVEECATFFHSTPVVRRTAESLCELGLGHLTLGHPLSELSGGEAQRLKLVPIIEKSSKGKSFLVFDEPTSGLHHYDVQKLIALFQSLTQRGHTVLTIEHNISLIAASDWIIDLGPEGGDEGGYLLRTGAPADFIKEKKGLPYSATAHYLSEYAQYRRGAEKRSSGSLKTTRGPAHDDGFLHIKGAREHNLKNISVDIPLNQLVAITGVSGSGKSTVAKDIIYAEGQRRYLDCLSPYARQFIKELKKPELDEITNVKPTICVYQHTFQPSALSTLGTMSEIYNYLRLLYAKTGVQYCPDHPDEAISPLSPEDIAKEIKATKSKSIRLLAPIIKGKKGNHRAILERAIGSEVQQIRVDGIFLSPGSVSMAGGLEKSKAHTIEFVLAKFNPLTLSLELLNDAVNQALSLGSGNLIVVTDQQEIVFSTERTCPICKKGFFKPDPEDLSFSSRRGACKTCSGSGHSKIGMPCKECGGARINELGRNLRLGDKNIYELTLLDAPHLKEFLEDFPFQVRHTRVAAPILAELIGRAEALSAVGLEYLALSRECSTLSGGELQRLRLATAMGSPLTGALYIFDEPSAGLHPQDNEKVLERLHNLRDRGNSILMIEHDAESILAADSVLDIGPGGGRNGGQVVFSGSLESFIRESESPTATTIRARSRILSDSFVPQEMLTLKQGSKNNINNLSLEIPLCGVTTVIGVSGSGKSSLVRGLIAEPIAAANEELKSWALGEGILKSSLPITRLIEVDQKPIGINSRSTPASYLGIWDEIRNLFASSLEAKSRGWKNSFFSYNTGKGRCPECKGQGQIKLEMNFLPDAFIQCEACSGARFTEEAKSVKYLGVSINEVLALTFEEAMTTFVNHRKIYQPLRQACDLGLGYLTLGQSSSTLSGGESQRIKLVSELSGTRKGHTLYVLDEPTTGLHKVDVARLISSLKALVALGNSVLLIEHDEDVIRNSDYLIEMGPGPGPQGGRVLVTGTPKLVSKANTPWGRILSKSLG